MTPRTMLAIVSVCCCAQGVASAAETITYSYDALGRLTQAQTTGGASDGMVLTYQYDPAGNRITTLEQRAVTVTPTGSTVVVTSAGAVLTVNVSGSSPTGTVTFMEGTTFLGSAPVINGQASVLLEGLSLGAHTITATYSGDGTHLPHTFTFTVRVLDLSWLPAILDLLLSD